MEVVEEQELIKEEVVVLLQKKLERGNNMSDRNSYQIAKNVVDQINSMSTMLRSTADSVNGMLNNIESLLIDTSKKSIVDKGLKTFDIDINDLKTDRDAIKVVIDYVKKNIPELTKL